MNKVIIIDWGIFSHRAIFSTRINPLPATYTCLASIIGCLKKIGVSSEDKVLIACDFLKSWRKEYEPSYKADRAKKREKDDINWDFEFERMNLLLDNLDEATKWHIIKIPHFEADDIMAVASRYYKDKEVVLVTYDSDLEQMFYYDNVKIFSPNLKPKRYKIKPDNFNVHQLIAKKIRKETSDNLVSPILNEEDYEKREKCINLLTLPKEIEEAIKEQLDNLSEKKEELPLLLHSKLIERFPEIYAGKNIVTYEHSVKFMQRKKNKQKKKKLRAKTIIKK